MIRKRLNVAVVMAVLLFAISCTTSIPLEVLRPADIVLDDNIQKIALVDRSKPSSGFLNVLEGLFSGEGIGEDREGRQKAMMGLTNVLSRTPRFEIIQTGITMEGSKGGQRMAMPLPWSEVERICANSGADALVVIESYDSDFFTSTEERERKKKDDEGNETIETYFTSKGNLNVRIGWRIYDPSKRSIIDEFTVDAGQNYSGRGDTSEDAIRDLPKPINVSRDISYSVGQSYAERIAPVFVLVNRNLFRSGKKPFKQDMRRAAELAEMNRWERADEIWTSVMESADAKTAGKAAVNLAISAEVRGDLQQAVDYVDRAILNYRFTGARKYSEQLNFRLFEENRAAQQMQNKKN